MVAPIVSFALGVLLIQQLPELPGSEWIVAGVILLVSCMALRYWTCLLLVAGILWAIIIADVGLRDRLSGDLESRIVKVSGHVVGLPVQNEHRVRFDLVVYSGREGLPSKLQLNWYHPKQAVKAGQRWRFSVKLKRPHGSLNPGGFDYERWLFTEGIGATGYVRAIPSPVLLPEKPGWFEISVWRQAIADELDRVMGDSPNKGVIKALTIGERHQLSAQQWDVFRQTGTVHLMAISGLHIGLVAGLVYFLTARFWGWTGFLRYSPPKVAAVGSMLAAACYAAMAGFSVPTQRALIMLAVLMLAVVWQRNIHPLNTLALALFAVLLLDPLAILSAGFWLSFLAVAVIAYTSMGRLASGSRWLAIIKINGLTALALSPLLLFFFQQVSLIAPVANWVAVPVVSLLVVPTALLALTLLWLAPALAKGLLTLADYILQGLNMFLAELAALPFAYLTREQPSLLAMILAGAGLLIVLTPKGVPARWLGWVMMSPLLFTGTVKPGQGEVIVTLLDVGQGLSAVVQTAHHALVFDTGARFDSRSDIGKMVLVPFIHRQGLSEIDALVVSHGDNDHIGGAPSLLNLVAVGKIYSSALEQLSPYSVAKCESGQVWMWDEVRFSMLAPGRELLGSENNNSCVLMIEAESGRLLLTGDIEKQAESWLVQTYDGQLQADVLVAPHHGSNTSSTTAFLQAVAPDVVLIPAGYKNRFGFPHQAVLHRYSAEHIQWLNTADQGAIKVFLSENGLTVGTQRREQGRYWNMKPEGHRAGN